MFRKCWIFFSESSELIFFFPRLQSWLNSLVVIFFHRMNVFTNIFSVESSPVRNIDCWSGISCFTLTTGDFLMDHHDGGYCCWEEGCVERTTPRFPPARARHPLKNSFISRRYSLALTANEAVYIANW